MYVKLYKIKCNDGQSLVRGLSSYGTMLSRETLHPGVHANVTVQHAATIVSDLQPKKSLEEQHTDPKALIDRVQM